MLFDVDNVVGVYVPSYCYFKLFVKFFYIYILVSCLPTRENM